MVELLSSGKINNRLLCELATHPNFRRRMIDMEICSDQIANMPVSYTHLDVYKRQDGDRSGCGASRPRQGRLARPVWDGSSSHSVSYTHLGNDRPLYLAGQNAL